MPYDHAVDGVIKENHMAIMARTTTATDKPPYRVPSMAEIAAIPWNGYTVASLFSGCGGSSLGYKMAGFRVAYANEFVPAAQQCYMANHRTTAVDTRDVRLVTGRDVLDLCDLETSLHVTANTVHGKDVSMACGELDVLDGSPPCAAFSSSGQLNHAWGKVKAYSDTKQRVDDLFEEYIRLVREIRPRTFVAENVEGLSQGRSVGIFVHIRESLTQSGYRVKARVRDADEYGVPQHRPRTFIVGVRDDLDGEFHWPEPLPYQYSVHDVFPYISAVRHGGKAGWQDAMRPSPTIIQSDATRGEASTFSACGLVMARETDGRLVRRKFTIDELKAICSFPDDFVVTGSYPQQWERLGRAVPPLLMAQIAGSVRRVLDGE
jgi:DNA (cytosine-5)-methyltransferase 1